MPSESADCSNAPWSTRRQAAVSAGTLDDGDGGSGTWVFACAQDAGRGHRLAPIERHPPMLEGQVGKSRSARDPPRCDG